jgi:hypothetical protein
MLASCGRQERNVSETNADTTEGSPLNYHALVIGIEDYAGTSWPQLGTARADAEAMVDVLRNRFGFNVVELLDAEASRGNILRNLDQFMNLTSNDALLIYFAGHGFYDPKMDEGYWIPSGAQRERMRQPAKEDWLWTSSISKVLDALPAKHVLVIADTCYGGSLFRGDGHSKKSGHWYRRAIDTPSRYLITSGNLEPVLDSGIRHSVFAQEILNFLQYSEKEVFAASDIGFAIREKVSALTGQLVRMGTLVSPADAGGEFVFVRNKAELPEPQSMEPSEPVLRAGFENPAEELSNRIATYSRKLKGSFIRPRILACLGPDGSNPGETEMIRTRLHKHLDALGGCILVERASFDSLLHEIELGTSIQADSRVATEIGKLLPASLVLFGKIIPDGNSREIHVRVVDTETSRVLASTYESYATSHELDPACEALSRRIMETINQARPLVLPVQTQENGNLLADWGRFHGARIGDTFDIIAREAEGTVSQRDVVLGTARLLFMNEESAEFETDWNSAETNRPVSLWLKETL